MLLRKQYRRNLVSLRLETQIKNEGTNFYSEAHTRGTGNKSLVSGRAEGLVGFKERLFQ